MQQQRASWQAVPGTFVERDMTSKFVSYYDGGVLRLIEERMDFGEHGSSASQYYFDSAGTLFLYRGHDEAVDDPAGAAGKRVVDFEMVFDPEGRMVASHKTVDGKVRPIGSDEIDGVQNHLNALRKQLPPAR
jgi:hypothetical protein